MNITAAIDKALLLPSLSHLYIFVFALLRTVVRFMDSLFFSNGEDDAVFSTPFDRSFSPPSFSDPGESIFLVSFRWYKEAVCGGGGGFEGTDGVRGVLYNSTVRLSGAEMDDSNDDDDDDDDGDMVLGAVKDSEIIVSMEREGEAQVTGEEGEAQVSREEGEAQVSGEEGVSAGDCELALVSEWMFFTALKWHYDKEDVGSLLPGDDVFSLKIRIMYMGDERSLVIKINQEDNEDRVFGKACSIFENQSGTLHVWDFSGQTNQLFIADIKSSMDIDQPDDEVRTELQIYGLPNTAVAQTWIGGYSSYSPLRMNGNLEEENMFSSVMTPVDGTSYSSGALGLIGLHNLGSTCFMNSAIQCLVHTPKLADYFLGNFRRDLNFENPLGMNGKLAIAFGHLLRKLWAPRARPVAPRLFKSTIASFAPQFSGYNQHDSQEFLSFLLDGLHEDLNRVKRKPYIQAKDEDGRPEEDVANEYWGNHLSRNDSIIVDLCQGQYRSTLVCPVCKKSSITFDPFMYLSLPLPSSTLRKMTLTILSTDGTTLPHPVTIKVPVKGTWKDLVEALAIACSLRDDETLLIAEIFSHSVYKLLDDPDGSIELIRDGDILVAYRLPKAMDGSPLVQFIHQREHQALYRFPTYISRFGTPLVARMSDLSRGSEIRKTFLNFIKPFLKPGKQIFTDDASRKSSHEEGEVIEDSVLDESEDDSDAVLDFEFRLGSMKIHMDELVHVPSGSELPTEVLVDWPQTMIQKHDTSTLRLLPAVCKTSKWTHESISLYNCVDSFLKEEPLEPDNMWYCPNCKEHRQASKKLDLWRLPEILVIHLKRFSFSRFLKSKLETFVDFPIDAFDLSNYITQKNNTDSNRYMLYAVSNHYGGMGGGHYTAFAKHKLDKWYEFDDRRTFPVSEDQIKTQAAYVLFYKRI